MLIHSETNFVRNQFLESQIEFHQLFYSKRTLRRVCRVHKSFIIMKKQLKIKLIFKKNLKKRVQYGKKHKNYIIKNF